MKLFEVLDMKRLHSRSNRKKARNIAGALKAKSRKNNPGDEEIPSGWRADPHQGGHSFSFLPKT
jgi:hypothetical protein